MLFWKDKGGKLAKQEVTIGEEREDIGKVCITSGLALTDSICFPDESLREGMKTAPMSEKPAQTEEESAPDEGAQEAVPAAGGAG